MPIRRISSGGPFEERAAYCRAVVAGDTVYVAGTCAHADHAGEDVVGQCRSAFALIEAALAEAGARMDQVVRVVYYLNDINEFEACLPVVREVFGAAPPAGTIVEAKLIDPADLIEIEVTAYTGA